MRNQQSGFTMIEVLVTIGILVVGLLGLAALQTLTQVAELESYQRSQAIVLVRDMADRMNGNKMNLSSYITSPDVGTSSPPRMFRSVDLPEPEGPSSTTNSPAVRSKSTPRRASTRTSPISYTFVSPRAVKTGRVAVELDRAGALKTTSAHLQFNQEHAGCH